MEGSTFSSLTSHSNIYIYITNLVYLSLINQILKDKVYFLQAKQKILSLGRCIQRSF